MLFVSTLPHSSAHPEAPACNALHFQVSLASGCSFVGTGDVNLVILVLTGQINSSMTLDLFLPTSGDRPYYGAMVGWQSDDDKELYSIDLLVTCSVIRNRPQTTPLICLVTKFTCSRLRLPEADDIINLLKIVITKALLQCECWITKQRN